MKRKNTNKLGIAAKDNNFPYKSPLSTSCKVSSKLYLEKYSKYKKTPAAAAKSEIKTPISMFFFTVPKNLVFESYDVLLNQTEQERWKHSHFLTHTHPYLALYPY